MSSNADRRKHNTKESHNQIEDFLNKFNLLFVAVSDAPMRM